MRSQTIRIHNLPNSSESYHQVRIKPIILLIVLAVVGVLLIVFKNEIYFIGILLILLSLFGLLVMPDKVLCDFHYGYMVLYNENDKSRCNIIYYDDIMSWRYEWHATYDQLFITLVDGTTEEIELYSKSSVKKYLDRFAPNKEVKNTSIKRSKQ